MFKCSVFSVLLVGCLQGHLASQIVNDSPRGSEIRKVRLEAFVRSDRDSAAEVAAYLDELGRRVRGLDIQVHDVLTDREQLSRLYALSEKFGRKAVVPSFYSCDRMYFGFGGPEMSGPPIENLFTADVYTRATCQRCKNAKRFISQLNQTWPAVRFRIYEITTDAAARGRWQEICRGAGQVPGLPTFDFARRVIVGYQGDGITGKQLEDLIEEVSGTKPGDVGPESEDTTLMLRKTRPALSGVSLASVATSVPLAAFFFCGAG